MIRIVRMVDCTLNLTRHSKGAHNVACTRMRRPRNADEFSRAATTEGGIKDLLEEADKKEHSHSWHGGPGFYENTTLTE